jgi:hypothetical protein
MMKRKKEGRERIVVRGALGRRGGQRHSGKEGRNNMSHANEDSRTCTLDTSLGSWR